MMLNEIRATLLNEASLSPQLLSDLAGLESYIAESYDSRSFIETLQNADDAKATHFLVKKYDEFLIIANNGALFSYEDFEAICRSSNSYKQRGQSIGYRGIGFKSVVALAKEVHLISGKLEATFSKRLTQKEISHAKQVPLLRIPHPLDHYVRTKTTSELNRLKRNGYSTFFILHGLSNEAINNELLSFEPSSLLFLNHIEEMRIEGDKASTYIVSRKCIASNYNQTTLSGPDESSNWIIFSEKNTSIAFYQDPASKRIEPLSDYDAIVHAFLPTHESTGVGIKINGDLSTDPSRTRVVFDCRTRETINTVAKLIAKLIHTALLNTQEFDSEGILSALVPLGDPRFYALQRKSFKSELIKAIKKECKIFTEYFYVKPNWINSLDFLEISKTGNFSTPPTFTHYINGFELFFRYLDPQEIEIKEFLKFANKTNLSVKGHAEIIAKLIQLNDLKQAPTNALNARNIISQSQGKVSSIHEIHSKGHIIDQEFIDLVDESGGSYSGLVRLLKSTPDADLKILPPLQLEGSNPIPLSKSGELSIKVNDFSTIFGIKAPKPKPVIIDNNSQTNLYLEKWRGAEHQVRKLCESMGLSAHDVSRQNLGYDIECSNYEGKKYFIEVKLVKSPNEPFTLTSNEKHVAREKGDSYVIAIVRQSSNQVEVQLITNPSEKLDFIKQCRQYVWECSEYPFDPEIFPLT